MLRICLFGRPKRRKQPERYVQCPLTLFVYNGKLYLGVKFMRKGTERQKVFEIIEKISKNHFDYNEIDLLFLRLREHVEKKSIFHEIANFVAHNEIRKKGLINDSLIALYHRINILFDTTKSNYHFDITKPFNRNILNIVKHQSKIIEEHFMYSRFSFTKDEFQNILENGFLINKNGLVIKKSSMSDNFIELFLYCINTVGTVSDYNQNKIIREIINALNINKFEFDENVICQNSNKIILSILLLLHRTKYIIDESNIVYTHVYYNAENVNEEEKYMGLYAEIFHPEYNEISFGYPIISTNLRLNEWCDNSILSQLIDPKSNTGFNQPLIINNEFKLSSLRDDNMKTNGDEFFKNIDGLNSIRFVVKNVAPKHSRIPHTRFVINQILKR
jgi:hypothetical protein